MARYFVRAIIDYFKKLLTGTKLPEPLRSCPPFPILPNTQRPFSDVTHALEMWNASAQQAAPALAEDFMSYFQSSSVADATGPEVSAVQSISDHVIPKLVQSLATKSDQDIVAVLGIAFEACLAFALYQTAYSRESAHGPGVSVDGVDQRLRAASESLRDTFCVADSCPPRIPRHPVYL